MKKLFLMAASALLVLSCNTKSTSTSSNGEEQKVDRKLTTQVFTYEDDGEHAQVKLSIEMPVEGDQELGDCIYDFILENLTNDHDCSDDLTVYRNDGQGLVDLFGGWKSAEMNEDWSSYAEDVNPDIVFADQASFTIVENNDNYVTCLYETESFNGADGYWAKNGVTFLKRDCSRVTNDFLFKDPTSPELVKVLRDDLIERYCRGTEANWDDPDEETVESVLDEPFYVTPEGLAYYYRRPLIFFQNVDGVLPWDKVKDLLTDKAKKLL